MATTEKVNRKGLNVLARGGSTEIVNRKGLNVLAGGVNRLLTMVTNHGYLPWLVTMVTNHGY